ncbi:hypothetical protein DERP_004567 [Dermatophagoides pteronyssinus]|uniref:Uncharacterized protein n=1 Tax=Dermatophagoides pteronyssinus TaxID=6956 RepID=A0ABQ8JPP7_DERPT|nr:hypothetical protein DERP_004567 [Dermatophagoides pteronyssinus]
MTEMKNDWNTRPKYKLIITFLDVFAISDYPTDRPNTNNNNDDPLRQEYEMKTRKNDSDGRSSSSSSKTFNEDEISDEFPRRARDIATIKRLVTLFGLPINGFDAQRCSTTSRIKCFWPLYVVNIVILSDGYPNKRIYINVATINSASAKFCKEKKFTSIMNIEIK